LLEISIALEVIVPREVVCLGGDHLFLPLLLVVDKSGSLQSYPVVSCRSQPPLGRGLLVTQELVVVVLEKSLSSSGPQPPLGRGVVVSRYRARGSTRVVSCQPP
jgi:hypothetical protein